jgi:8-oxo-dGTP pyrophosphatase MutT (NUDIX family)
LKNGKTLHSGLDVMWGDKAGYSCKEFAKCYLYCREKSMTLSPIQQAAAIPIRAGRVCLVSSRGGKRWVVPKGCIEPLKTPAQIALQEAWEEAGLVGVLEPTSVGSYLYEKSSNLYEVTVFLMHVTEMAAHWPEVFLRRRLWVPEDKAPLRVESPGLQELLRKVLTGAVVST